MSVIESKDGMVLWVLSDTHSQHRELEIPKNIDGIIHAGDFTTYRDIATNYNEAVDFFKWLSGINVEHKLVVPGNHDTSWFNHMHDSNPYKDIEVSSFGTTWFDDVSIATMSHTPEFGIGWAYNATTAQMAQRCEAILGADIVVTHGPPRGILDSTTQGRFGCPSLAKRILEIKPKVHLFGHFHNEPGHINSAVYARNGITYVNASVVDLQHKVINNGKLIVI